MGPLAHFDATLDRLFRLTGTDVRLYGRPLLGLPGSIDLPHGGVVLALPEGALAPICRALDRRMFGGLAAITVLRSPHWRAKERMLVMGHDAARLGARRICTVDWWTDEQCAVWTSQSAAAGALLVSAWGT